MKAYTNFSIQLQDQHVVFVRVTPQTLAWFMNTAWNNEEKVGYFEDGRVAVPYHSVIAVYPKETLDTPSDSSTA